MRYRCLGETNLMVSEIGFGTWGLGGDAYGPVDAKVAIEILQFAFESGITFYDTADLYGDGHSEELLGKVFSSNRSKVIIATKGGNLPHHGFTMPQDFSQKHLKKALEGSLRRLKTDYIDIYQMHSPTINDLEKNNVINTLNNFKNEGKIRHFGVSVRSPSDGISAIKTFNFPIVQVNFNMIDQRAIESGFLNLAKQNNTGVIVRTPLVFGYLTGNLNENTNFKGMDHRTNWPKEQMKRWASAVDLFSFLYKERTPVQTALRYCLDFEIVSTVIPGMMNKVEVDENYRASELPSLANIEHQKILDIYNNNNFYDKKSKVELS